MLRKLLAAVLIFGPVLYLLLDAALVSDFEFLRPSQSADWIVHPEKTTRRFFLHEFESDPVFFSNTFELAEKPTSLPVQITALGRFRILLNGAEPTVDERKRWKQAQTVDLAPHLRAGGNRLMIRVENPSGPPALLVEATRGSPLCTSSAWAVSLQGRGNDRRPAAAALRGEGFLHNLENPLGATKGGRILGRIALFLLALLVVAGLLPMRWKPWRASTPAPEPGGFWRRHGLALGVLCLVASIQVWNAARFQPADWMADTVDHWRYISYVDEHWRVPLANEGWEMYQPPLFYFAAAALPFELLPGTSIRVLNTLVGLLGLFCAWVVLARLLPGDGRARFLGFSVVAFLPMSFYANPNITNEVFAGGMIGLALCLACWALYPPREEADQARSPVPLGGVLLLGAVCGLALLSKYTALFATCACAAVLGLRVLAGAKRPNGELDGSPSRATGRSSAAFRLAGFALVVGLVAGWFYVRNITHFGDPFVGNWDAVTGYAYEQWPGYRTAGFYARFGEHLWHLPQWAGRSSFWEGLYATTWTDARHAYLPKEAASIETIETALLWLGLLPTVGLVLGFGRCCSHLIRRDWDHPYFLLVVTTLWTLGSVLLFTLEVPSWSTVKGIFFLSLIPALGVFAGLGLSWLCERLGGLRFVVYANLAALYGCVAYTFSAL